MGRCFLRRLFDLLRDKQHKRNHDLFRVPAEAYRDLMWWKIHAKSWNGIIHPEKVHCFTDACLKGGAAIFRDQWFYVEFEPSFDSPIVIKEFHIVVLALQTWGPLWKGHPVLFHVDNQNVGVCNNKTSKSPAMMHYLRNFLLLACQFCLPNFEFCYIPSSENTLADSLSRKNFAVLQTPNSSLCSSPIPTSKLILHNF